MSTPVSYADCIRNPIHPATWAVVGIKNELVGQILKVEHATRPVTLHNHPISLASANGMRIFTRASSGLISMPYEDPRWTGSRSIRLYELDFFAHGGASGGPVFLRSGHVFGVVSASRLLPDDTGNLVRSNLSLAIDIREAVELAHSFNIKPKLRGSIGR